MKPSKSSFILKSFDDLKVLLEKRSFPPAHAPAASKPNHCENKQAPAENEKQLFKEAMTDVKPIIRDNCRDKKPFISVPDEPQNDPDAEIVSRLSSLVDKGEGFVVADTPEYIEGTGYRVDPKIAGRLHRGDFAIEAHIDLHGFSVENGKEAFEEFMKEMVSKGKRALLIIHGRGLCSPKEPVIKTKVEEWLTRGAWRKWVLAYASARACDGGTGATYVLLRRNPATRRLRKTKREKGCSRK